MNVNQTAFCTITTLAVATGGAAFAAAMAASTAGTVAYAALAALGSALSIASMTAWGSLKGRATEGSPSEYFQEIGNHLAYTIPAVGQFIAHNLVAAVFNGIVSGISQLVSDKITGRRTA